MSAALFLIALIASATAFTFQGRIPTPESVSTGSVSGFPYKIDGNFGIDRANTLLNFINSASVLYRDDYKQNLFYIHSSMSAAYGEAGVFGLIIQGNSTSSYTDSFIYGGDMASFSAGINMINPSWSYYAYLRGKQDGRELEYIPPLGRGAGINDTAADALNQILKKGDELICRCNNAWTFNDLSKYDGQRWNVVCHSSPITYSYVPVYNSQWMATKPGSCYYVIYVL